MKYSRNLLLLFIFFVICRNMSAQIPHISLCSLEQSAEKYLNSKVEVEAFVYAGVEYPRIALGQCSFRFATGNDYQVFGERFPVDDNEEWKMLNKLLSVSECASNIRVAKAKLEGTIIRVPATGTISQDEMPLELVIQSVSEVEHVPVKCTPPSTTPRTH